MRPQQRWILACWIAYAAAGVWGQDGAAADPEPTVHPVNGTVADAAGQPVAGATVWLRIADQIPERKHHHEDWFEPISTETNERGRFTFSVAADGPYRLFAMHPLYPPLNVEDDVAAGATVELSFLPALAFSGEVLGKGGAAIEGSEVLACGQGAKHFGEYVCLRTRATSEGSFRFERLSAGRCVFQAWAPGSALSPVERRELPVEDRDANALVLELGPGAEVSGTLADDTARPLPGVVLYFESDRVRLRQARDATDVQPIVSTITGEDGSFAFAGLPAGEALKIYARIDDRATGESETLTLKAGSVIGGVSIVYRRPASAVVRVINADETPVGALDVLWRKATAGKSASGGGLRMAGSLKNGEIESLGEGRFSIREIRPGRYDVTLLPSRYLEIAVEGVEFKPGAEIDLGTRIARPGVTLTGTVTDDLGAPIEAAEIRGMYLRGSEALSRSVETDAEGRFALGGLGEAPLLSLRTQAQGHASRVEQGVRPQDGEHDIVLDRVGTVRGRITLESGDVPVAAQARLEDAAGGTIAFRRAAGAFAEGDENGHFEITNAAPGTYALSLTAKDARPLRVKDVVVSPGRTTDIGTHRLEPGLELRGTVFDRRDGSPVGGAAVSVTLARGGMVTDRRVLGDSRTDSDGNFVVAGLVPGHLRVDVFHADYAPGRVRTTLAEDTPGEDLTVQLGQGGLLRGTVLDENGAPAPDRVLGILEGAGLVSRNDYARTDAAGEYKIERMRPGAYRVMLYGDPSVNSMDVQQKNASIREGEITVVNFGGRAKIAFEGQITRGGHPLGEVTVMLVPADRGGAIQTRSAATDLSGRFEVGLDRPGEYTVIVQDLRQGLGVLVGRARVVVPDEPTVSREIALQTGSIGGTVTNDAGAPIEGAVVSGVRDGADLNEIAAGTTARAAGDGTYRLGGVHEGSYTVSAVADGYETDSRSVAVSRTGAVEGVDFRLEGAVSLTGRVVDSAGNAVPGALVFAAPAGAPEGATGLPTEADSEGAFRLSAPSRGPCDLTAVARGYAPGALKGYVPAPDNEPGAVITLTSGGTIRIRVVDAEGRAAGAVQPAVRADRPSLATLFAMMLSPVAPTDASGSSVALNLPGGDYRVSLAGHSEVPAQPATVREGGQTEVTLRLP